MKLRKTKIVATIGPASEDRDTLRKMFEAGANVCRLNFSHGTHEYHQSLIDSIKAVREDMHLPIPIMLDTKGPEYRIKTFANGKVTVKEGDRFTFTAGDSAGDETKVSVTYKNLAEDLNAGDIILVNNGLVKFEVEDIAGTDVICRVVTGGELSDQKSMSFPNKVMSDEFLSAADRDDLLFGIRNGIDFVAASFVSCKQDMEDLRTFLDENGGKDIEIIAKIENQSGVDNIDEICELADGIMVARGDLGVEIPFFEVPSVQKYLIDRCRLLGRRVITATEMLESMIQNPRPTRAEISDVANAVYDGSSAIMLSGETAAGKYPVEAIEAMAAAALFTEQNIDYDQWLANSRFRIQNNLDAISHAVCSMASDVSAKAIVVNSMSGQTARMVSRFRAPITIVGRTTDEAVWRKLNLSWGVLPLLTEEFDSLEVMFYNSLKITAELLDLKKGDNVVMTGGSQTGVKGSTNTIKVATV